MSVKFKPAQIAMPASPNYGRWYAKMVPTATVSSQQLAEEVAHSSTVTQADMLAVLWSLAEAIRRHLLNSEIVHVDGLGSLRIGFRAKAKDTPRDVSADDIHGLRVVMTPERKFQQTGLGHGGGRKGYYTGELIRGVELASVDTPLEKKSYR